MIWKTTKLRPMVPLKGFSFAVIMAGGGAPPAAAYGSHSKADGGNWRDSSWRARFSDWLKFDRSSATSPSTYLSHIIEDYFGDGRDFGIEICYLREQGKLGTAGALCLLPEQPFGPILVMNGDVPDHF